MVPGQSVSDSKRQTFNNQMNFIVHYAANLQQSSNFESFKECYQASPYGTLSQIYQNGTGVPPNSYVLFVTYIQDNLCAGNLYAYATSCQNDPLTDRPVMGYLNMCPDMFSKRVVNPSEWVNIIKHEVGHALNAARKHFNCKTLDGVDLENEGSLASAGSHFEARIYGDELMVAELQKKSLITPILLAYMNDTGGQSYYPYCDKPSTVSCRSETSYGMCSIQKYTQALPTENQYFTNPRTFNDLQVGNYGGGANFMDYCPMLTVSLFSEIARKGMNVYMQTYGAQSICIEHSGHMTYYTYFMSHNLGEGVSGSCHLYHCLGNNSMSVDFAGQTVICSNGEVVKQIDITRQSSRLLGTIKCPPVQLLCPKN
ncbi:unnamed protein product [Trichobilharzia szidati]|nr:unnamed protein product [Trichobilharzia szidati]